MKSVGEIISFVSPKSGTGTSTLARAFAVEAAYGLDTIMVDLDRIHPATWEWGQRRAANRLEPVLRVEILPHLDILTKAAGVELLVVDAPAGDQVAANWLVRNSLVTIVPMRGNIDDLSDTMRLLDGLAHEGVANWRLALTLCRVQSTAECAVVREALTKAGYVVLQGEMRESNSLRNLQERGRAITESSVPYLTHEAYELMKNMQAAFVAAQERSVS